MATDIGGVMIADSPVSLRDRFLDALDVGDRALCKELAVSLTGCTNRLPNITCDQLGLPQGSFYASAARLILGQA